MATAFHEDPRFYRMGPGRTFATRLAYAVTRPLITRTDGGRDTANLALLSGTLAAAGLTNAYYPAENRGARQTFLTFGSSVGGTAFGDIVREFYGDFANIFHSPR
jgi:hypothetical protein